MRTYLRASLAAALVCLSFFAAHLASACSVCLAGDPSYTNGASSQEAGSITGYFETRGWTKSSGVTSNEDGRDEMETQRLDLYLSWTPIDRATFTLDVPWVFNSIDNTTEEEHTHSTLDGLGDVSITASVLAWRNRPALPSTWVEVRGFLKTPTGRSGEEVNGEQDPHLQPGTGSWDSGFGLASGHHFEWGSIYGSAFQRWNNPGGLHYQYGNATLVNAIVDAPLGHLLGRPALDQVVPGLELNFRYGTNDHQFGEIAPDTGGAMLFVTPTVRWRLPWFADGRMWLRVSGQIPVTQTWLHGVQHEDPVWSVGVGYRF
jgi:hypothetical protein